MESKNLATANIVTGDPVYAHKAGVLLDRVADLYPSFDFQTQAVVYEHHLGSNGYVSIWHDACEETRGLAIGYDAVFEALRNDEELVKFLSRKAKEFKLPNPKASFADIQRNIEEGILRDALRNEQKIHSNYPRTPFTKAVILSVLSWEHHRDKVMKLLDETLQRATAVDSVTGEKGLAGYGAWAVQGIAEILALFDRARPDFLGEMLKRHLRLRQTFRFHIDTWVMQQYYPNSGDAGAFARKVQRYVGVAFMRLLGAGTAAVFTPSMFTFLWQLYELTGDTNFVRVLEHANNGKLEGLPHDLFAEDQEAFQKRCNKSSYNTAARFNFAASTRLSGALQFCVRAKTKTRGLFGLTTMLVVDMGTLTE